MIRAAIALALLAAAPIAAEPVRVRLRKESSMDSSHCGRPTERRWPTAI